LRGLVGGLWEGVVEVAIKGFFGAGIKEEITGSEEQNMVLVRQLDLGRR
jgi:tubulin--tyrosine ligase